MESLEEESFEEEKNEKFLGDNLKNKASESNRINREENLIKFNQEYVFYSITFILTWSYYQYFPL